MYVTDICTKVMNTILKLKTTKKIERKKQMSENYNFLDFGDPTKIFFRIGFRNQHT